MDNENQRELDVLAALEGIHRMQESIRDTELDIVVETGIIFLRKAIMATVGPEMHEVTSEQVGVLKLMKLAVETDRFMQQLKKEGREQYSIGEYVEKVYNPVINL